MKDLGKDEMPARPAGLSVDFDFPKWVWLAPVVVLVIAVLPLPYSYYIGLRWFVTGVALFLAWKEYERHNSANSYMWIFGAIAILYNPIIPVHFFKGLWVILNLGTAAVFLGHYRLRSQGR